MKSYQQPIALSDQQILDQLNKILSFHQLQSSKVLQQFLKFIVTETLGGRETELKEYTIAVKGLGRPKNFNPQQGTIIRTYAIRLRKVLDNYYNTTGRGDAIRVAVPKGAYVPQFNANVETGLACLEELALPVNDNQVPVAVIPFTNISANTIRQNDIDILCDEISKELSCNDISVISYYFTRRANLPADDQPAGQVKSYAKLIITGSMVELFNKLYLNVQLINIEAGKQLWAGMFEQHDKDRNLLKIASHVSLALTIFMKKQIFRH